MQVRSLILYHIRNITACPTARLYASISTLHYFFSNVKSFIVASIIYGNLTCVGSVIRIIMSSLLMMIGLVS